jgi:hypothetical protein
VPLNLHQIKSPLVLSIKTIKALHKTVGTGLIEPAGE